MGLFSNPLGHTGYPPGVTGTPETQPSAVRAATQDEVNDGILDDAYVSPLTLSAYSTLANFAAPPPLGDGTPNEVFSTTLDVQGAATINTTGTAATSIGNTTGGTAVTGDLTVTSGNVIINSAAKQLRCHGGAVTDFIGTTTLTNGVTSPAVANTNIAATDRILIVRVGANASTAFGTYDYTISAGASFTITAKKADTTTETGDLSTLAYFIVRQV